MTKFGAFSINFEDAEWLYPNIDFALKNFDQYVVVDGADSIMMKALKLDKPDSGPATQELYRRNNLDVIHPTRPWIDKVEMCNAALDRLDCDYVLQLDTDEFYTDDAIFNIKNWFQNSGQWIGGIKPVQFWKNFNTVLTGNVYTAPFVRLFKKVNGFRFIDHRPPKLGNGSEIYTFDSKNTYPGPDRMFHFGYLGDERVKRKSKYFSTLRPTHPKYSRHMTWYEEVWKRWDVTPALIEKVYKLHITGDGSTRVRTEDLPLQIRLANHWPPEYWNQYPK